MSEHFYEKFENLQKISKYEESPKNLQVFFSGLKLVTLIRALISNTIFNKTPNFLI